MPLVTRWLPSGDPRASANQILPSMSSDQGHPLSETAKNRNLLTGHPLTAGTTVSPLNNKQKTLEKLSGPLAPVRYGYSIQIMLLKGTTAGKEGT